MIYSPDHNFLLLKNIKVGGTSMEVELSQVLPENAVVTPIKPKNESHVPRNYDKFSNHTSIQEFRSIVNDNNVMSYVFVRNPYDVVLSRFFHILNVLDLVWEDMSADKKSMYLDLHFNGKVGWWSMQTSTKYLYLSSSNDILVNKIFRYEDGTKEQINPVLLSHGIPEISMTTYEKKYRPESIKPSDVFLKEHFDKIESEWFWEIEKFGYSR
jgi:hypothetical protein